MHVFLKYGNNCLFCQLIKVHYFNHYLHLVHDLKVTGNKTRRCGWMNGAETMYFNVPTKLYSNHWQQKCK